MVLFTVQVMELIVTVDPLVIIGVDVDKTFLSTGLRQFLNISGQVEIMGHCGLYLNVLPNLSTFLVTVKEFI